MPTELNVMLLLTMFSTIALNVVKKRLAHLPLKTKNYPDVAQEHYLALTTQNSNFEAVEPNKILGLALYFEKKAPANEIAWLQSNPSTNHESGIRTYKKIGTTLVNYMKGLFKKPLYVQSADNAIPFYQKQGFKSLDIPSKMIYEI